MSAKLIFVVVAAAAAIGSAVLAGLIVALVGLFARTPDETVVTLTADTAATVFGGVIALSGIAASLFFKAPEPAALDDQATSLGRQRSKADTAYATGSDRSCENTACDGELRAAVEARALVLKAARAEQHERADLSEVW